MKKTSTVKAIFFFFDISVTAANVILIYQRPGGSGWFVGKMLFVPAKGKSYFPILANCLLHAFGHVM